MFRGLSEISFSSLLHRPRAVCPGIPAVSSQIGSLEAPSPKLGDHTIPRIRRTIESISFCLAAMSNA